MAKSNIQWTDYTWNIAVGCTKVDADCKYCYMYRDSFDAKRYDPKEVRKTKTVFNLPLTIKQPAKIFTSSLTDFFHPSIDGYRHEAWEIIRKCPHHTFQILTKRPERIRQCLPNDWGDGYSNVWLGTSVGSNEGLHRISQLAFIPAALRFISFEPLYEQLDVNLDVLTMIQFKWVIIGGESGNETGKYQYRPCQIEWIEEIANAWQTVGSAVFIKQMGTYLAKQLKMSDRHGGNINEFPPHLQIREFPKQIQK